MKIVVFFVCLLAALFSFSQSSMANCEITLKVIAKRADIVLGHGGSVPKTHSVVLRPKDGIRESAECVAYSNTREFHMNNVEQHDKAFQVLKAGDIITGTLNYHRPSPYGKSLNENYHHGFRLLTTKDADYNEKYVYFRHIGLY